MRVGMGYDVHRLAEDRKMIFGRAWKFRMKRSFGAIRMQMCSCMRLWMRFCELRH